MRIRDDHRCIHACDAATAPRRFRDGDVANDNGTDIDIDIDIDVEASVGGRPTRVSPTIRRKRIVAKRLESRPSRALSCPVGDSKGDGMDRI